MTISSALGFDPIWSTFNLTGVSAGGAKLYSYDSLNPTVKKPIYSDPALEYPYENPISFDLNGNAPGPFYFRLDSLSPSSLYDLFLYDTNNNLIWEVNNYFPSGGSGGGSTTAINLDNLLLNGVFWRNVGGMEPSPTPITITSNTTTIAPGAHDGFSFNINPIATSGTANYFGPDIYLLKNGSGAVESVTFKPFILGSTDLSPDVTPFQYVNHKITGSGSSETYRYYQIPISNKVQNLSNQTVTVTIWAQGVSGPSQVINMAWAQFFGDGTAGSPTAITTFASHTLNNSWAPYRSTVIVPNVSTKTLGQCGNDGLFLLIGLPLTSTFEINFIKPSIYLGPNSPRTDFVNYDVIDAAINSPRTGDIRTSLNNFLFGYVAMNDGTIGSASSTATSKKGIETFPLFNLLWNSVNNAYAPVIPSRGVSAIADFVDNKAITLTKALGRVFAGTLNTEIVQAINFTAPVVPTNQIGVASSVGFGQGVPVIFTTTGTLPAPLKLYQGSTTNSITYYSNILDATHIQVAETVGGPLITITSVGSGTNNVQVTPYQLGQFIGEELHNLNVNELASHTHNASGGAPAFIGNQSSVEVAPLAGGVSVPRSTSNFNPTSAPTGSTASFGHNNLQPTTYMNVFIKL